MRRTHRSAALVAAGLALATVTSGCSFLGLGKEPADLQVYSARHYGSEEVFKKFTEKTGITVDFIDDEAPNLIERIKHEGKTSPADIFMTVDAGNLWNAADQGLLAKLDSPELDAAVPADLRDADNRWFGLVSRARTVVYNPEKVKPTDFDAKDTYAGLDDPKWKGRLCMRDTSESYTSALVAALVDLHGRDKALQIVKGWVANDVDIMANDVLLLEAVEAGTCDVAITNHYYLARNQAEGKFKDLGLYWASQEGAGVVTNVSGAGVVATSDAKGKAQQLLEWLASPEGQEAMLEGNHEFPVNPAVKPDGPAAAYGPFKRMPIDAAAYGKLNAEALDLLVEADYK